MRILVCGSRHFDDLKVLHRELLDVVKNNEAPFVFIEGGAKGADFLARCWAKFEGYEFEEYPANWKEHGKKAGPIRNKQMLDEGKPDLVIAFLAPNSRGTKNMIEQAEKAGVPV